MEGRILKEKTINEIKALTLLLFVGACGYYVLESRVLYFLILSFFIILVDFIFINKADLSIARHILFIILAIYNVISAGFMIQYIRGVELDGIFLSFLKPFLIEAYDKYFVGLILIFTSGLMISQNFIGANNAKKE